MRRHLAFFVVLFVVLALAAAAPTRALELPARKAGLWQLTMSYVQPKLSSHSLRQCTDPAVDKLMNSLGGAGVQACSNREVHQEGGTITVDSLCSFAGATTASHAVITGSFDNAYTMTVTVKHVSGPPLPGAASDGTTRMEIAAKWLGPCGKGQRPGDIIMGNGMTINVLDLQKQMHNMKPPR